MTESIPKRKSKMIRCKPLLGTYVEITLTEPKSDDDSIKVINEAFVAIEQVQELMSFHHPQSELSRINAQSHQTPLEIHPWTEEILRIAQGLHKHSDGLFNCGIGQHLIKAGLLPKHTELSQSHYGGIEHIQFLEPNLIRSDLPLCLDLGGIAKGFAVDKAVMSLEAAGVSSGIVNAGGDMRVFGEIAHPIHIRNPIKPDELFQIGFMHDKAVATSGLYFSKSDAQSKSYLVNPLNLDHVDFPESYSIFAKKCVYADALSKVVALSGDLLHPCLNHYSSHAVRTPT